MLRSALSQAADRRPALARAGAVATCVAALTVGVAMPGSAGEPKTCFDPFHGKSKEATITGNSGDNEIRGTEHADVIYAGGGNDEIDGRGGSDVICAGAGNDEVIADWGFDTITGEGGNDQISGDKGYDAIYVGAGENSASGGDGTDVLTGGGDDDRLRGGDGNDELYGLEGDDDLAGKEHLDMLEGGAGNDRFTCQAEDDDKDEVSYEDSPSPIVANIQRNTIQGEGTDLIERGCLVTGSRGDDLLIGSDEVDHLSGYYGDDTIYGDPGGDIADDYLSGDAGGDEIWGGSAGTNAGDKHKEDVIYGDWGNVTLNGRRGGGSDELHGQTGADLIVGEPGSDELFGGDDPDVLRDELGTNLLDGGSDLEGDDDCRSRFPENNGDNTYRDCED